MQQDLQNWLERPQYKAIAKKMSELAALLSIARYEKWQEWQTLQNQFLEDRT